MYTYIYTYIFLIHRSIDATRLRFPSPSDGIDSPYKREQHNNNLKKKWTNEHHLVPDERIRLDRERKKRHNYALSLLASNKNPNSQVPKDIFSFVNFEFSRRSPDLRGNFELSRAPSEFDVGSEFPAVSILFFLFLVVLIIFNIVIVIIVFFLLLLLLLLRPRRRRREHEPNLRECYLQSQIPRLSSTVIKLCVCMCLCVCK